MKLTRIHSAKIIANWINTKAWQSAIVMELEKAHFEHWIDHAIAMIIMDGDRQE